MFSTRKLGTSNIQQCPEAPGTGWLEVHHLPNKIDSDSVVSEIAPAPTKFKKDTPLNKHN